MGTSTLQDLKGWELKFIINIHQTKTNNAIYQGDVIGRVCSEAVVKTHILKTRRGESL